MIGSWPHVALVVVLVCPHFPSLRYIICLSPSSCPHIPVLRQRVVCTAVQSRAQFSQFKTVDRAETFESWPPEKGVNSKWKTKKKTCPWLIIYIVAIVAELWRGLPAVLKTLEDDNGDMKALWSQSIYRYVLQYIVDNAGRHDIVTSGGKG